MSTWVEWDAIANIVVVGLIVGAGLPALFALGVRALAAPSGDENDGEVSVGRKIVAGACFAVTLAAVAFAVAFIAAGGH